MNTFYFIVVVVCLFNLQVGVSGQLIGQATYGGSPAPVENDDDETSLLLALLLLATKSKNSCNCCQSVQPKYIPVPFPVPFPVSAGNGNASKEDDTTSDNAKVCFAQDNNGQTLNPNLKFNTFGGSEKGSHQGVTDNANFRGNYINFAANHFSQSKLSQNRVSNFFNQKAAAPLENYQNTIFPPDSNQQQLSNIRQQINVKTQDLSTPSAFRNTRQDPNLYSNINLTPSNELPLTSNILPAPNIAGNSFLVSNIPNTQTIIPPSLTISTSLPSFVPTAFPNSYYNKLQPVNQVSHDTNANKVFVALAEPSKITRNSNSGNYYYVPPKPGTDAISQKSLNMKSLLPLILKLLNDENEDCPCCSYCHRCNNKHNLAEIPLVDSGYSKQRTYGSPSEESYEDSESGEESNNVERTNAKFHKNRGGKHKYHRRNLSDEDKESQSAED